jgi:molybdopterin converting factor small subunit
MITVTLPAHLRSLAGVQGAVTLQIDQPITQRAILDALEDAYPMLRGTIRDGVSKQRRPFIRFFACGEDLSHVSIDAPVPGEVAQGKEPFRVIGAMAGG